MEKENNLIKNLKLDNTYGFIDNLLNDKINLMDSVHRQATISTIKQENIAQHSFHVAYYALKLSKALNLSEQLQGEIVIEALIHDIAETSISDVPSNVKHSVPELKPLLDKAEDLAIEKYFPEISDEFKKLRQDENEKNIKGTIIKIADIIAFIQFCLTEEELGNKTQTLTKAKHNSTNSLTQFVERLQELIKKNRLNNKNNNE